MTPVLLASVSPEHVLIIDSSSSDGTADLARAVGFGVMSIDKKDFNHGTTRQLGAIVLHDAEVLVYLTQDTILQDPCTLERLLSAFADPSVAAAYGRQLPRPKATPIEAHARSFNYPAK